MSKLLLHIGPHKTGSTFIQKFFADNSARLAELGVHYPQRGLAGQYGQHELVEKVRTLDTEALIDYLAAYLGGESTFLSSENFDRLKADDLAKLAGALAALLGETPDVRILFYHRNYADLLPSWWQEEVKHGGVLSFHAFVLPHVLRPFASNLVNPGLVLDLWASAFGKERVTIVDYDRAREDLLAPIFSLLGVELGAWENQVINSSMKVELVEVLRALNSIAKARNEWHFHRTRALFLRKMRDAEIADELDEVLAIVRAHLKSVKIAGGFFEKAVGTAFRAKYESRYLNRPYDVQPERDLQVADDVWLIRGAPYCERIFDHLMSGDVSY